MSDLRAWLIANREQITHFRPRRWCGVEMLIPYDRRKDIPMIQNAPMIYDTKESADVIREVLGPGMLEERFQSVAGSNNY